MKKTLALVMALAMVMTAFFAVPLTADAAGSYPAGLSGHFEIVEERNWEEEYDIYNGFHNPTVVNNAPNATYDYKTNTLTLTNFTNSKDKNFNLRCDQMLDLTIKVVGNCSIGRMELFETYPTFTGTGTLTINPYRENFVGLHIDLQSAKISEITPLTVASTVTVKVLGSSDDGATPIDIRYKDDNTKGVAATEIASYADSSPATISWETEQAGGPYQAQMSWSDYGLDYNNGFPHLRTVFPYSKLLYKSSDSGKPGVDNIYVISQDRYEGAGSHWVNKLILSNGVWYESQDGSLRYYMEKGEDEYKHYTNGSCDEYATFSSYSDDDFTALPDTIKEGGNAVANLRCADMGELYTKGGSDYLLISGEGYYPEIFEPTNLTPPGSISSDVRLTMATVCHSEKTYWVENPVTVGSVDYTTFNTDRDALNEVLIAAGYQPKMQTINEGYSHIYRLIQSAVTFQPSTPATPAHTHSYSWVVTKAATCSATGTKVYKCSCGSVQKTETIPMVAHKSDGGKVTKEATYTATGVKTYKCTVCGKTLKTETIAKKKKKENPLKVKQTAKTKTLKYKTLKKKAQSISIDKFITVSKAKGTVSYSKTSGSKKITVDKKTGKIKVAKGLKKGSYKVKIKVSAAGTSSYKSAYKTVTVSIKVS